MNGITIARPGPSRRDEVFALFETVLRDTFEKNGLSHLREELEGEIAGKRHYLQADLDSGGRERYFLLALREEAVVGTVEFGPAGPLILKSIGDEAAGLMEVGSLFVHPSLQGGGIGSGLLKAAAGELQSRGMGAFCLDSGYPSAQKVWRRKFGEPRRLLKDHWGPGLDHMVWLIDLSGETDLGNPLQTV